MVSTDLNPNESETVIASQWLQALIQNKGILDLNLYPSDSDSFSVVLYKILAVLQK